MVKCNECEKEIRICNNCDNDIKNNSVIACLKGGKYVCGNCFEITDWK